MLAKQYAKALCELSTTKRDLDTLLTSLDVLLEKRGHVRLKPAILRALMRILREKQQRTMPVLTLAKNEHATQFEGSIKNALDELGASESPETKIDETIAGGYALTYGGQQIDNTYKTKLLSLYRSITTNSKS